MMTEKTPTRRRPQGADVPYYTVAHKRYEVVIALPDGRRKTIISSTKGTKKEKWDEIQAKLTEAKAQIERGVTPTTQTVKEYLEAWMAEKRTESKSSTDRTWSSCLQVHIIPELGAWQLTKLKRPAIVAYFEKKQKEGLAPSTLHFHHEIIADAFNDAVKNDVLVQSPCKNITLPRVDDVEMLFLDAEQARQLLSWLKDYRHKHEALIMLAITTGMRMGEIQCLHWQDVDFDLKLVHVRRTLSYYPRRGYTETDPKTKRSRRTIPLTDEMVTCLHAHRAKQLENHLRRKIVNKKDLVFCGQTDGYYTSAGILWMFKKALKMAGLPEIRFHDLRHTFATLMLSDPVRATLVELRDLMGHTSIQTTIKYLHVIPARKMQAITELGKVLFA